MYCFFDLVWHLVLFGSEKAFLLTVKNLLIAPGGPNCLRRATPRVDAYAQAAPALPLSTWLSKSGHVTLRHVA